MLRIATPEDYDITYGFAEKFLLASRYGSLSDKDSLSNLVKIFLSSSKEERICILSEEGMIAGQTSPFMFGAKKVATELGWWVEPEHRKSGIGKLLLQAFEAWAKKVGCDLIVMISLDDELGKFYEANGYILTERSYIKEI